jgi:integrase
MIQNVSKNVSTNVSSHQCINQFIDKANFFSPQSKTFNHRLLSYNEGLPVLGTTLKLPLDPTVSHQTVSRSLFAEFTLHQPQVTVAPWTLDACSAEAALHDIPHIDDDLDGGSLEQHLDAFVPDTTMSSVSQLTGLSTAHTMLQIRLWNFLMFHYKSLLPPSEFPLPHSYHHLTATTMWHRACLEIAEAPLRGYATSTRIKLLGTMLGLAKRATLFATLLHTPLIVSVASKPPQFVFDMITTMKMKHRIFQNLDLPELSPHDARRVLRRLIRTGNSPAILYFILMYKTAARSTSILNLQVSDVHIALHADLKTSTMDTVSLRFREGKTMRSTGTYTLHILMSSEEQLHLRTLLTLCRKSNDRYLFGPQRLQAAKAVSAALLTIGSTVRACRRGCLRYLARQGATVQDLLLLSRHTTPAALYQYLGGGLYLKDEALRMVSLSTKLATLTLPL